MFANNFPVDTAEACAKVLCRRLDGDSQQARLALISKIVTIISFTHCFNVFFLKFRAWRSRNIVLSNAAFIKLWRDLHPIYPSQVIFLMLSIPLFEFSQLLLFILLIS